MKTNINIKKTVLVILAILLLPGVAFAAATTSVVGPIGGANCIITKKTCPMNSFDPHLALERDFVLSASGGKYYFLPNISRSVKTSFLNKPVRVTGKLRNHAIHVSKIEVENSGEYLTVWDWDTIKRKMNRR